MDMRILNFDSPADFYQLLLQNLVHASDDDSPSAVAAAAAAGNYNNPSAPIPTPTRDYVRDARAMASTPADIKEYPNSYVFIIDMPGLKPGDINVQIMDDNVLLISGERKREEENDGATTPNKYVRMERRVGKFMRKFALPENADTESIEAVCQDGVLTVTLKKLPPPEPKKPKIIQVNIA